MSAAAPGKAGQASLRRMREFAVHPNRELGQNFLVDDNILEVIGRAAELGASDVALEVGGGLGVLSEYLAPRVDHLHVVEVDAGLVPALEEALAPFANATLHVGDAVRLSFAAMRPSPTKVVANLPYGVATTVILKSIEELDRAELWVAMVQREVAERLAAPPGSKVYGASSVLAQTACEVRVLRRISASVFYPVPRVASALCVLRRRAPAASPELGALIHAAFRHRRKTLAGSLELSRPGAGLRDRAREALAAAGLPPESRAERLGPREFAALAERLGPDAGSALLGRGGR